MVWPAPRSIISTAVWLYVRQPFFFFSARHQHKSKRFSSLTSFCDLLLFMTTFAACPPAKLMTHFCQTAHALPPATSVREAVPIHAYLGLILDLDIWWFGLDNHDNAVFSKILQFENELQQLGAWHFFLSPIVFMFELLNSFLCKMNSYASWVIRNGAFWSGWGAETKGSSVVEQLCGRSTERDGLLSTFSLTEPAERMQN